MRSRRQFIKTGLWGVIGITGILTLLKYVQVKSSALPILTYPNPILRGVSSPVTAVDDDIIALARKMIGILRTRAAIDFFLKGSLCKGMSAPQIGVQKRLVVCGLNGALTTLVNPEILEKSGSYANSEYCLSLPEQATRRINRSAYVKVGYQSLQGTTQVLVASKQSAGLIEHEIDHLNGVLYIDYA